MLENCRWRDRPLLADTRITVDVGRVGIVVMDSIDGIEQRRIERRLIFHLESPGIIEDEVCVPRLEFPHDAFKVIGPPDCKVSIDARS